MDPIYNLGVATYRNAVKIAAVRNPKAKLMLRGQRRCPRSISFALGLRTAAIFTALR